MKGMKRLGPYGSNLDTNDSAFHSKRIMPAMAASPFDDHRAEPSRQHLIAEPKLDAHRAASAQQHVRALNTQFASWVQSQMQNHPNELWEDGVQDYLTHASQIMEKFRDVVDWLKANAAKAESASIDSHFSEKKLVSEGRSNEIKPLQEKSIFGLAGSTFKQANAAKEESASMGSQISEKNSLPEGRRNEIKPLQGNSLFGLVGSTFKQANVAKAESVSMGSQISEKNSLPEGRSNEIKPLQEKSVFGFVGSTFKQANAAKAESVSMGSQISEKNSLPEPKSNEMKPLQEKSLFGLAGGTSSFTSSWNSSIPSNNQSPVLFGWQNSVPLNREATDDADGENEIEQPSSPSVKKTEEKGIVVVHEVKCKLYVKSTDPVDKDAWKDKGMGQLSIKCKEGASKATKESKPTVVVRNDVGKVLLNALLYPGIKTNMQKNSIVTIFHTLAENEGNDDVIARTYLIRTKTEEERNKLAAAIQEYAPAS